MSYYNSKVIYLWFILELFEINNPIYTQKLNVHAHTLPPPTPDHSFEFVTLPE